MAEVQSAARDSVLVYRDRIVPRSEASFLRRQYFGFERLAPVWIGCRVGDGLEDLGVEPIFLGRSGALGIIDTVLFRQFWRLPPHPDLRVLRPRVIHAHFGRGGALALPIARALKIPLVVTFHGGDATKDKHYSRRLIPTIYQRRLAALQREASAIVCVSDFIRDRLLSRGFPADKLRVLRYGVDVSPPRPQARPPAGDYLLFVGRFVEKKGIPYLIDAMRLLKEEGAAIRLVLIGDGPLSGEVAMRARPLGNVEFHGWLPQSEVREWMRGALAVCVPSVTAPSGDTEGLPNVVIEAMAQGVPVIGSRHSGIIEAVEDGRTGVLVPPGDPAALARAIQALAADPQRRQLMGAEARRRADQCFNAVHQSRLLEDLLLSVSRDAPQ